MAAMRTLMLLVLLLTSGCCESPQRLPPEGPLPRPADPTVDLVRQLVDGIGSPYDEMNTCRWCGAIDASRQEHARGCAWARAVELVSSR